MRKITQTITLGLFGLSVFSATAFAMGDRDAESVRSEKKQDQIAYQEEKNFSCRVVGVSDGDTITCLTAEKIAEKIRLAEIDAPEKKQAFGERSKENLSDLIFNKNVGVIVSDKDRYGRLIGYVQIAGRDVNYEQIADGMAHFYRDYGKTPAYEQAETQAKRSRTGLWADRAVTRPQDFRKGGAIPKTDNRATGSINGADCSKKTCKQMTSCDEAYAVMRSCGYVSLDGDRDGVPCAALCN